MYVGAAFGTGEVGFLGVTSGSPVTVYRSPGYLEIVPAANTARHHLREVLKYQLATPTGFTGLTRAVEGPLLNWSGGDVVSAVFEGPHEAVPVIMAAAEGNMYGFWRAHRALYDQFTAVAGIQGMAPEDLLGMIRSEEDRADRRYRKVKKMPAPGIIQRRHHRPR